MTALSNYLSTPIVFKNPSVQEKMSALGSLKKGAIPCKALQEIAQQIRDIGVCSFETQGPSKKYLKPWCCMSTFTPSTLQQLWDHALNTSACTSLSFQNDWRPFARSFIQRVDLLTCPSAIETVRDVQQDCMRQRGEVRQYVIFAGVDQCSAGAQEALLKLVEEPPLNLQILLEVSHFSALAPTLLSRCLKTHIVFDAQQWIKWLAEDHSELDTYPFILSIIGSETQDPLALFQVLNNKTRLNESVEWVKAFKKQWEKYQLLDLLPLLEKSTRRLDLLWEYLCLLKQWCTNAYANLHPPLATEKKITSSWTPCLEKSNSLLTLWEESFRLAHAAFASWKKTPSLNHTLVWGSLLGAQMLCLKKWLALQK